jgi:hypothetical protein
MQFMTVDEIAKHALADHERGEEIAPGVVVERRAILRFGIAAAGLAAVSGLGLAGCASRAKDSGNHANTRGTKPARAASADEFVAAVMPQARALIAAPAPDEEAYLAAVTALLARVEPPPTWRISPTGEG